MIINLKNLDEAVCDKYEVPSLDIDTEAIDVVELVKDFSAKILDFIVTIRSSAEKIAEQLDTFGNIDADVDPALLQKPLYGYDQDRFDDLVAGYLGTAKDIRTTVRYLAKGRLDNAAKMADRVAKYLGMRNDVFKLKRNPEIKGESRDSLKDHGFSLTNMVEHRGRIRELLRGDDLNTLRKSVEREMSKADDNDQWVKVAYKFATKSINELAGVAIELGNQQLHMLKMISK